jgi:hypothetical protein
MAQCFIMISPTPFQDIGDIRNLRLPIRQARRDLITEILMHQSLVIRSLRNGNESMAVENLRERSHKIFYVTV